ncbi:MAG TPA: phosphatase PAP2 family protein [Ktedonobacterales bacterium]
MSDPLQQALQDAAVHSSLVGSLAVFCAVYLVFVMAAGWLVVVALERNAITLATIVRVALLVVVSFAVAKVLNHVVSDPRPYLVAHTTPLAPTSGDNGFPSDHTLMAAALTASLWWFARRYLAYFVVGMVLVALGRLGIEAHHTLDVVGSMAIVLVVMLLVSALPLPAALQRPALRPATGARRAL